MLELVETVVDLTKMEIVADLINKKVHLQDLPENATAADVDSGKCALVYEQHVFMRYVNILCLCSTVFLSLLALLETTPTTTMGEDELPSTAASTTLPTTVKPSMSPREIAAQRKLRERDEKKRSMEHAILAITAGLKAYGQAFQTMLSMLSFGAVPLPDCPDGMMRHPSTPTMCVDECKGMPCQ